MSLRMVRSTLYPPPDLDNRASEVGKVWSIGGFGVVWRSIFVLLTTPKPPSNVARRGHEAIFCPLMDDFHPSELVLKLRLYLIA